MQYYSSFLFDSKAPITAVERPILTAIPGTHGELVRAGGIYAELVKAQQFQPEPEEVIIEEDIDTM